VRLLKTTKEMKGPHTMTLMILWTAVYHCMVNLTSGVHHLSTSIAYLFRMNI